jgi:hypothetical protein
MNKLIKIPLLNLTIATLIGALLRFIPVHSIPSVNYKFFLHAHSHVAFLGWAYMALFLAIALEYLPSAIHSNRNFKVQFWATQISVMGMLITFPLQGYALFSIIFSTAQIILSYIFFIYVWKNIPVNLKSSLSFKFILPGFFFLILSSAGPWALGIIMSRGMSDSPWYNLAIYFYLHFQYNGWFAFIIFGLLLKILENSGLFVRVDYGKKFLYTMFISCLAGYSLSTLWLKPPAIIYALSFASALLQLVGLYYLLKIVKYLAKSRLSGFNRWVNLLLLTSLTCLIIKSVLQFFSVFIPIFEIRNLIIAYLHLTLIGFITFFIIAYLQIAGFLTFKLLDKLGLLLIFAGFILSETLLFSQGGLSWLKQGLIPHYYLLVFSLSALMPIGFIFLTISRFMNKR